MGTWNTADILGALFLCLGALDGYRKGMVKKGTSLVATLVTLFAVYLAAPYVERLLEGILPSVLSLEKLVGEDSEFYQILALSGLEDQVENGAALFAARILSVVLTYVIAKVMLRTLLFSAGMLMKVPGLSFLNRVAGACLGLLVQLLGLWVLFLAIMIFSGTNWGGFLREMILESHWLVRLYENNLLLLLATLFMLEL